MPNVLKHAVDRSFNAITIDGDCSTNDTVALLANGAAGGKDMGKVIGSLKADYPGRIDFGKAAGKVKAALG